MRTLQMKISSLQGALESRDGTGIEGSAMQLNEVGSRHSSSTHHVTNCMHDHTHIDKVGKIGAAASSGTSVQSMMAAESQAEAQFSLAAWLDKTLNGGRKLWGSIWGNGDAEGMVDAGGTVNAGREAGAEQIAAILPQDDSGSGQQTLHAPQIAAAVSAIRQPQDIHNNLHFSPAKSPEEKQEKLWRRMRVKLQNMAGQLTGRSSGKSLSAQPRGSSQVRRERLKEDLRKQSRSRRDELVINSVQTDDSYLLDSYDRKGAYSKLSARK